MSYGRLEVICGPMFSGKSTELISRARKLRDFGKTKTLMLKPAFDTRYGEQEVLSHDQLAHDALPIASWIVVENSVNAVFIDEIQFMSTPLFAGDIVREVQSLLHQGKDVYVAGLDTDWQGNPFAVTASMLAMADQVSKKTAHCHICGKTARKTFKKHANSNQVELGETDLYQARCNKHWHPEGVAADLSKGIKD